MSLFDRAKRKKLEKIEEIVTSYFSVYDAYSPSFSTFEGGIYEMELTRACVHAFANHCSKLNPHIIGKSEKNIQLSRMMEFRPNYLMDTKKYLYRLATVYLVKNNAYIIPLFDDYRQKIIGVYPAHPSKCQFVKSDDTLWMKYSFETGICGAAKFSEVGRMTQFQNKSEIFGDGNEALQPTLEMLDAQRQAIMQSVRNSSDIKLLAKLAHTLKDDDIKKMRNDFTDLNFKNNASGMMVIDPKISEFKQLYVKQFTVDDKQMAQIKENAFYNFGCNDHILQNNFTSDEWNAYYEGKIEPFALEAGLVHTQMFYNDRELSFGNKIEFSSNRMNYLSTAEKVSTIQILFDRGMLTQNGGATIMNLPADIPDGDRYFIRKEYIESYQQSQSDELKEINEENKNDT